MATAPVSADIGTARTLGRQAQWPLILGFFVLVLVGAINVWLVRSSAQQNDRVEHSFEVRAAASRLLLHLQQAETGQRGYLLVGGDMYLDTHREGMARTLPTFDEVARLTADNPTQTQRLIKMRPLIERRLDELRRTIALKEAGREDQAMAIVRSNAGKRMMDDLRRRLTLFDAEEARLLEIRSARADRGSILLLAVTLAGLAVIVLLAVLAYRSVARYTAVLRTTSDELQILNSDLEGRVAERTADLSAANEEIQRYAYIVSHDLRAPLVNIMGFTAELNAVRGDVAAFHAAAVAKLPELDTRESRAAIEQDLPEAIGFISTSTAKMDRLINAILKISREGGRVLSPEPVDVTALAENVAQTIHHQAGDATIRVDPLPPIVSDRLAVEQVMGNLIENAVKYLDPSRPGEIVVSGIERGGVNEYAVTDNGRGIAPGDHERVFDLFRRSGTQDRPGEGIGLAHVRALVRRLGGTISLKSEFGVGSTFTVSLPKTLLSEGGRE